MTRRRTLNGNSGRQPAYWRLRWTLVGVVALAATTAAGLRATSDEGSVALVASATPSTTAASGATTTAAPTAAGSTSPGPPKVFCDGLRDELDLVQRISISLTDPPALRPLLEAETAAIAQLSTLATPSAARDVDALKRKVDQLKSGMDGAGYDLSTLPPAVSMTMLSPDLMGAVSRLAAFVQGAC